MSAALEKRLAALEAEVARTRGLEARLAAVEREKEELRSRLGERASVSPPADPLEIVKIKELAILTDRYYRMHGLKGIDMAFREMGMGQPRGRRRKAA